MYITPKKVKSWFVFAAEGYRAKNIANDQPKKVADVYVASDARSALTQRHYHMYVQQQPRCCLKQHKTSRRPNTFILTRKNSGYSTL